MIEENILDVQHLKKYFKVSKGLLHAVDDVTFQVARGTTIGVVGESGCGKSTLGRSIMRLTEPTAGSVIFEGKNILNFNKKELVHLRSAMQIIFQDPFSSLNPRLSISEIIAEPLQVNKICSGKKEVLERVYRYMDMVGLARRLVNTYPHELDGGRRQRIGIARALALEPKFIVCDEPVSALDVSIQAQILNLLQDLQEEMKLTYMFITHDLSVVKHISDRIIVMYLGKLVEVADVDKLFENPLHPYTKALLEAIPVPDYDQAKKPIEIIQGEVTSPINPRGGCRFAGRCPKAEKRCFEEDPELKEVEDGHQAACFLL